MKRYEITEESLIKALHIGRDSDSSCVKWYEMIDLLGKLCVPVEKPEGWVECVHQGKIAYRKGKYHLSCSAWLWSLSDTHLITNTASMMSLPEAKAWADEQIALYEEKQKIAPYFCTCSTEKECPVHPKPKRFGPGTRLRAANGDEIEIIGFDDDEPEVGAAYNRTKKSIMKFKNTVLIWLLLDDLKKALLDSGATIIEE